MVRRVVLALVTLAALALGSCSPGLWLDDGYYMCLSGECPSVAPYCWSDHHCHRAAEVSDAGVDGAPEVDASTSTGPSFTACSAGRPCTAPEICTPLGVCSRECTAASASTECGELQCSPSELPSGAAYCRPSCEGGCPSGAVCGRTRSVSGDFSEEGACVAPFAMFETARHYEDCDTDASCGPYACIGRVSASQPGICLLSCEMGGLGCPVDMACVRTAGDPMPTACLFTCTALDADESCIPQHMTTPRCEERTSSLGPRLVCIDAAGL